MLDNSDKEFDQAFLGDDRQLGVVLTNFIEEQSLEGVVAHQDQGINWNDDALASFFDGEAAPSKVSFAAFMSLLERRSDTGEAVETLRAFWAEWSNEEDSDEPTPQDIGGVGVPSNDESLADTEKLSDEIEASDAATASDPPAQKEPARIDIARNIKAAAAKAEMKPTKLLQDAGVTETFNVRFLVAYEKGNKEITEEQLVAIVKVAGLDSVDQLKTGKGLEDFFPRSKKTGGGSLVSTKRIIELPPINEAESQDFFRNRVLNAKVEPAEGVPIGEIIALARDQDKVDWRQAWLQKTKEGEMFRKKLEATLKTLSGYGKIASSIFIEMLVKEKFPPSDPD